MLLSHLHWDHVQGLPFFVPLHRPGGGTLDVYGPHQDEGPLGEVFTGMMQPAVLPDHARAARGRGARSTTSANDDFPLSTTAKVRSRWIRHVGPTLGYRVETGRASRSRTSPTTGPGTRAPTTADDFVPEDVLELCDGVDLLIHDAQHTADEFEQKRHWGHCTVDYAVHVAKEAGAQRLALFHHDPTHGDDQIDTMLARRPRAVGRA